MGWIVGVIAVLGFAYLMFINERFRRFGFGVIGVIVLAIVGFWYMHELNSRHEAAYQKHRLSAINISQLTFSDMRLRAEGSLPEVSGTLHNLSPHTLNAIKLKVSVYDCPSATADTGCITTGEDVAWIQQSIPAGQARRINGYISFGNPAPAQQVWRWGYQVTEIEAELPRD